MYAKLHEIENYCVNLKNDVNFEVAVKQNYATEVTIRPAAMQKYGFAGSTSAFAVSTKWQVRLAERTRGVF